MYPVLFLLLNEVNKPMKLFEDENVLLILLGTVIIDVHKQMSFT